MKLYCSLRLLLASSLSIGLWYAVAKPCLPACPPIKSLTITLVCAAAYAGLQMFFASNMSPLTASIIVTVLIVPLAQVRHQEVPSVL
jgi:hypothetical protein